MDVPLTFLDDLQEPVTTRLGQKGLLRASSDSQNLQWASE